MNKSSDKKRVETLRTRIRKAQVEIDAIQAACHHLWKEISRRKNGFDGYSTNYDVTWECERCLDRRFN